MLEELDKYAEINYTTRSDVVRKALGEMLKIYRQ
jgi:metal-responsive CopG/Arc/MetJ family transcriptional regulator